MWQNGTTDVDPLRDLVLRDQVLRDLVLITVTGGLAPPMRTLLLLTLGPVAWAMGFGAVPLAVFLATFGFVQDVFPDPDQRWIAFAAAVAATATLLAIMARLFRVYDRMTAATRGDVAGAGAVRGTEAWACRGCGAPVTVHDAACRACGTLTAATLTGRGPG
ncbi:MAG: hypothetical protein AVDCRST_MAG77-2281 [uncultured Chloroflexi bacterium]|uniref:Uncharacterized protein n=1 Tax=uncultured Chloroflexota bacterium TaxID=166587 RepID=A0A6J4IHA9_9CHLR|nr:MAG: hypothetical protein AVDCRST_MAG77-2281 [uncultured Chloroflexota bacterium]